MMKAQVEKLYTCWNKQSDKKKAIIKAVLIGCIWILGIIFFVLNRQAFYGVNKHGNSSLLKKKAALYFFSLIVIPPCLFAKNKLSKEANRILNIHIMEWFPVICFFVVELVFQTDLLHMAFYRIVYNILLYMVVMYLFYAVTGRIRVAVIGVAVFSALFGITNIYLIEFRQIPLLASDFTVLKTAMNVAGNFNYHLSSGALVLIGFAVLAILLSGKIKQEKPGKKHRIVTAVCYLCLLTGTLKIIIFSNAFMNLSISINTFRPIKSYKSNGALLTFTRSVRLMLVEKPDGYRAETVEEIAKDYESDHVSDADFKEPNVIVIMNEAFADLQSVGNFETNEEVIPFYKSLHENTVKGFAHVSVFGGQTANSEFEFLTGDSKAFLPKGSTPYQLYIKDYVPSLTGNLKLNQYQGILAMHPYYGSGYNRVNVYQNFGFNQFITNEDFVEPKLMRSFISDESDFERIIEEYEKAKAESDDPFYLFNVTMQNHSSYTPEQDNVPDTIRILTPECQDESAQRYLNLIHLSDAALEKLIGYFEKQEEPTVVVMFGDHEPGLSNSFYESIIGKSLSSLTDEENMELYKVPFLIWANYDIEEQYIERTSLNYLHSIMLDVAGMKKSAYNKYLLNMMQEVPAINISGYFGADGNYYDNADKQSPYYEKINEYSIMEYNHLFDRKRKNEFFELLP